MKNIYDRSLAQERLVIVLLSLRIANELLQLLSVAFNYCAGPPSFGHARKMDRQI